MGNDLTSADGGSISRRGLLLGAGVAVAATTALRADPVSAATAPAASPTVTGPTSHGAPVDEDLVCEIEPAQRMTLADDDPPPPDGDPSVVGQWSAPFVTPFVLTAVHAALLHTGKVLLLRDTDAYLWDPVTGDTQDASVSDDCFCSGHTILATGDVLFLGGKLLELGQGPPWTNTFHPATATWTKGADMARGRWYPSGAMLADGRVIILSGKLADGETLNNDIEVWKNGVSRVVNHKETRPYPHLFVLPSGDVLVAGPRQEDVFLIHPTYKLTTLPLLSVYHEYASGTLLPGPPSGCTKVLIAGGGQSTGANATDVVEMMDTSSATPTWTPMPSLPEPRSSMNVVILPDGQLLGVGGINEDGAQKMSLLFDQASGTWSTLTEQTEQRAYHSTAVLLPDGRVLSAGDTTANGGHESLEIYSPPYLFKGPQPTITSASATPIYGRTFKVLSPDTISRVVLLRPNAITHTCEMSQRHVELAFTPITGGVAATAPPSALVAPPGYYMLFVLNADGVPSVGRWVHLGR